MKTMELSPDETWVVEYIGNGKATSRKGCAYWTAEPSIPFGLAGAAIRFHSKADADAVIGSGVFSRSLRDHLRAAVIKSDD